jgi:hypothetical protein
MGLATKMSTGKVTRMQFDFMTFVVVAGSIGLAIHGVWKIIRERRRYRGGASSTAVYHAQVVSGVFSIVLLPLAVISIQWLGYLMGFILVFIGLIVVIWADETLKNNGAQN